MALISMSEAAKRFAVSRPTLSKALRDGKITGKKVDDAWQLDTAELMRVYKPRGESDLPPLQPEVAAKLPERDGNEVSALQAEIRRLQDAVEAERQARALVERHLDDLRRLLTDQRPARRRWWPWGG